MSPRAAITAVVLHGRVLVDTGRTVYVCVLQRYVLQRNHGARVSDKQGERDADRYGVCLEPSHILVFLCLHASLCQQQCLPEIARRRERERGA